MQLIDGRSKLVFNSRFFFAMAGMFALACTADPKRDTTVNPEDSELIASEGDHVASIQSSNGFKLYVNGKLVGSSRKKNASVKFKLANGKNVIALSCANNAKISITGPKFSTDENDTFKIDSSQKERWTKSDFNDSDWKLGIPAHAPQGTVSLRKTVLTDNTQELFSEYTFWNEDVPHSLEKTYTISRETAQLAIHRQVNNFSETYNDIAVYVDLPTSFSIVDMNDRDKSYVDMEMLNSPSLETTDETYVVDDVTYSRHILRFQEPLPPGQNTSGYDYFNYTTPFLIRADSNAPDKTTFYTTLTAENGAVMWTKRAVPVDVFPAPTASPKSEGRYIQLATEGRLKYLGSQEQDAIVDSLAKYGVDEIEIDVSRSDNDADVNPNIQVVNKIHQKGIKAILALSETWGTDYFEFDEESNPYAIAADGSPYYIQYPGWAEGDQFKHRLPCPSWLLTTSDGRETIMEQHRAILEKYGADGMNRSLEVNLTEHYCFCPVCRAKFAKYAKLGAVPSAEEVKTVYWEQWKDFRRYQHGQITGLVREGCKRAGSEKRFKAYSGLQSQETKDLYMTDWTHFQGKTDIAIAGIVGSIEDTKLALGDTPWMGRVGTYAFNNQDENDIIYSQYVNSGNAGIRLFQFFSTTAANYYLLSQLAQHGADARGLMPEGYEIH